MLLVTMFEGAVAGLLAVTLMTFFEVPFWLRFGMPGVVQWQVNEILTSKLLSEPYAEGRRLRWAIAMHLLHGIVLGSLFSILVSLTLGGVLAIFLLAASAYSVALWLIVPFWFRKSIQRSGRTIFTKRGMAVSLLAHLVYGIILGGVLFIFSH